MALVAGILRFVIPPRAVAGQIFQQMLPHIFVLRADQPQAQQKRAERKGRVIAIVTKGDTVISKIADTCIELPETMECLDPLITTVPLQLLAYHIAVCKGMDVDQPRNLAKSVTVE